jgi:hypothetical protein
MKEKSQDNNFHFPVWLTIGLVLVIATLTFLLVSYFSAPAKLPAVPVVSENQVTNQPTEGEASQAGPFEVYFYTGLISNIETGQLTLQALAENNSSLEADKPLQVSFGQNIPVVKITVPQNLPPNLTAEQEAELVAHEILSLDDLSPGLKVTVVAEQNILRRDSFQASRIEILEVR